MRLLVLFFILLAVLHWVPFENLEKEQDEIEGISGLYCLAYDSVAGLVYAGGQAENQLLFSSDSGAHWQQRNVGLPSRKTVLHLCVTPEGTIIAAVADDHLFQSFDRAKTWHALKNSPQGLTHLLITRQGWIYGYGQQTGGIFRSIDGGNSWEAVNHGLPASKRWIFRKYSSIVGLVCDRKGILYAAVLGQSNLPQSIYASFDGGDSWQRVDRNLQNVKEKIRALTIDSQNILYLAFDRSLYFSQNGAKSWHPAQPLPLKTKSASDHILTITTNRKGQIFVTTVYATFRGDRFGRNWQNLKNPLTYPRDFLVLDPTTYLTCGYDPLYSRGIFRTSNAAQSWEKGFNGYNLYFPEYLRLFKQDQPQLALQVKIFN